MNNGRGDHGPYRNTLKWRLYAYDREFGDQIVAAIYRIAATQLDKWSGDLRMGDPFFPEFTELAGRLIAAAEKLSPEDPDRVGLDPIA